MNLPLSHDGKGRLIPSENTSSAKGSPKEFPSLPLPLRALDAKGEKRAPASGCPFFWWTIKGSFSRELRARSSAALTGLAAARSRSGSDSTLCCHSLPSRRYATLCCHSLPLPLRALFADGEKTGTRFGVSVFLVDHQGLEPWTDRL